MIYNFSKVGRAAAVALLDVYNCNPWSRLPTSEYKSVSGVRDWVSKYAKTIAAKKFTKQDRSPAKL